MKNKEKNFISSVVYVRNDEDQIKSFLERLNDLLKNNFEKYEIILVNDGSTDQSVREIKEFSKKIEGASISIINMSFYQGKELAINAGLDMAIGDFVYEFDNVNMDYNSDLIMDIYKKSLEGYDIVIASPNKKRKLTSKIFYKLFNKYSDYPYKIDTETFRILSRRSINRMNSMNKSIPYRKAIQASSGLKITTISYNVIKKYNKKADKYLRKEREKNALDALILFTDVSYKGVILLTSLMLTVTVFMSIYTIVIFLLRRAIAGWTTTMLFLSFSFFGIFLIFAIIIKYLSILINLIFRKMSYLIESVEKLN